MTTPGKPAIHPAALAVCHFYVRTPAGDGLFTYERVTLDSWHHDSALRTAHPPLPGDLITLWDSSTREGGQFRVIERAWSHATFGSMVWPYREPLPTGGPSVDIIVEAAEGPFRDQPPGPDDEGPA